jgi:hypothetical protein
LKAKRHNDPQPLKGIADTTVYETLRPSVMILSKASHDHPAVYSSTSGVLVQNIVGDRFMTGASHGIGADKIVYQELGSGQKRTLGKAVQEISFTDVNLVQLEKEVDFVNETFENSSGAVPTFTKLFGEDPGDTLKRMSTVYMNSSFSGNMEGVIVATSIKFGRSTHPVEDQLRHVAYNWAFMSQEEGGEDKVQPPDGTCGSVIWDDDGVVVGFHHYHIRTGGWAGFSVSTSAAEVANAGYRLG